VVNEPDERGWSRGENQWQISQRKLEKNGKR